MDADELGESSLLSRLRYNNTDSQFDRVQWSNPMSVRPSITALLFFGISILFTGCSGTRPGNLGVKNGMLAPCPGTPNCVSSQSLDQEHAIKPLIYAGTASAAHDKLKKIVLGMKRAEIITDTDNYIYAESTSAVWRFVDDVEFWIDEDAKLIHIRSASRLGKSDLGVNRKRMEEIRALWNKTEK
jgi:uncharacterized protein (DUF1499 family)